MPLRQALCETGVAAASTKMLPRTTTVFIVGSGDLNLVLSDGCADKSRMEGEGCLTDGQWTMTGMG